MRILIVEDDPETARLIRDLLELQDYTVIEASNGLSVMRIINEHVPDLIFMDINLPGMDGITLTKLIKSDARTGKIPVIALTSAPLKSDRERFILIGCDGCISKPFHVQEILDIIEEYKKSRD